MDKMNLPGRMLGEEFRMREGFVGQACIKHVNGNLGLFVALAIVACTLVGLFTYLVVAALAE
ncbi:hypothetical protein KAM622c_35170 [Klebsiella quasipneumoniae subsp. quasipneumoniae]|nr:hypothetical protein KAM622c_35170 [Klebsiella quasipneumoniae subsp. quasipneumoniae]